MVLEAVHVAQHSHNSGFDDLDQSFSGDDVESDTEDREDPRDRTVTSVLGRSWRTATVSFAPPCA